MTRATDASRLEIARDAARAAADVALERFRTDLDVETKSGPTDVVTDADRRAQRRARGVIAQACPDEPVVGEENDARSDVPATGTAWIVDPIDGTNNYVRGVPFWCSAVAAVEDGEPVAAAVNAPAVGTVVVAGRDRTTGEDASAGVSDRSDPARSAVSPTLWWPRDRRAEYGAVVGAIVERFGDLRRYGSAQLTLAMVATGAIEATVTNVRGNPWDTVAGAHLVRQAGGTVTDVAGERWRHDSVGLVASNGRIHEAVLGAARSAAAVRHDGDVARIE